MKTNRTVHARKRVPRKSRQQRKLEEFHFALSLMEDKEQGKAGLSRFSERVVRLRKPVRE